MAEFLDFPRSEKVLDLRDKAMLELLYASGIRVSELIGLNLEDLNFDERLIRVKGKGKKERMIPFGRTAEESLQIYISRRMMINKGKIKRRHKMPMKLSGRHLSIFPRKKQSFF